MTKDAAAGVAGTSREARAGLPFAAAAVVVWLVLAALDGGYWPSAWGPLGLVLLALVALSHGAPGRVADRRRTITLALLALFVVWCFLSTAWADFAADAWAGSNKTLLYTLGVALFLSRRWSARALEAAVAAFALGLALLGAATIARILTAGRPQDAFADGRLLEPTGYVNGSVALWTLGMWAALQLAAHPRTVPGRRALLLGSAALLLQLALLGQSRAWLVLLPVATVVALLLSPRRLRLLGAAGIAAGAAGASAPTLLAVRDAALAGELDGPLQKAATALALASVAAAAAGALWALTERRVRPSVTAVRRAGSIVAALAAVGCAGVAFAAAATLDDPRATLSARWEDFTNGTYPEADERLGGSLASNRYRHWLIAWEEFREHPLAGAGVDNYYAAYLLRRERPDAEPRYPHSWALRLLAQTGIVGTALFLGFAASALLLALRARRALGPDDGAVVAAGTMPFAYWLLHGAGDWFWEIPALTAPALGLLALAAATAPTEEPPPQTSRRTWARRATVTAGVVVVVAAAASFTLPWLAHLQQRAGTAVWRSDRGLAYDRLEAASSLNPLSAEPLLLKGSIALRTGDVAGATDALRRVVEREPRNWYGWFQLAIAAAARGDYPRAEAHVAEARALNPLDPVVAEAATLIRDRRPIDPLRFDERFQELARRRTGEAGG